MEEMCVKSKGKIVLLVMFFVLSLTSMAMAQTEEEFIQQLTREGMTAAEMLQIASEKMNKFDTYRFDGLMDVKNKIIGCIDEEQMEQNVHMIISQEGVFKKPQKVYVKSKAKNIELIEDPIAAEQISEVFMEDATMYMRVGTAEKWMKIDFNPMVKEIQKLAGNKDMASAGISQQQMELYGMFAYFDEDKIMDGKEYYVIAIDLNSNTFKRLYKEIIDKTLKYYGEIKKVGEKAKGNLEIDPKEVQAFVDEMIEKMEMEISYKFYINKETKVYEKMEIMQNISMNMEEMNTQTYTEGKYTYYDFNKEVTFPNINPEEIQDMKKAQ